MKKRNLFLGAGLAIAQLVAVAFLVGGCETESVTQTDIQITPAYTELSTGQSVTLSAAGWSNYRWSVKDGALGYVHSSVGQRVVYTATAAGTQVVVVTADTPTRNTVDVGSSSNTVVTVATYSGEARVLQK